MTRLKAILLSLALAAGAAWQSGCCSSCSHDTGRQCATVSYTYTDCDGNERRTVGLYGSGVITRDNCQQGSIVIQHVHHSC